MRKVLTPTQILQKAGWQPASPKIGMGLFAPRRLQNLLYFYYKLHNLIAVRRQNLSGVLVYARHARKNKDEQKTLYLTI